MVIAVDYKNDVRFGAANGVLTTHATETVSVLLGHPKLIAVTMVIGQRTIGVVVEYLKTNIIIMDKVMMFTDCQMWNSYDTGQTIRKEWDEYKKIAPNAKLYLFDLAGYGAAPLDIVREDVYLIAGWSDRIFEILTAIENGSSAIEAIKKIEI